jgi:hypothetical protein
VTALALNEKKEHLCAVNWKAFRGSGRGLFQGTAQICHSPNVAVEWLSFLLCIRKIQISIPGQKKKNLLLTQVSHKSPQSLQKNATVIQ